MASSSFSQLFFTAQTLIFNKMRLLLNLYFTTKWKWFARWIPTFSITPVSYTKSVENVMEFWRYLSKKGYARYL